MTTPSVAANAYANLARIADPSAALGKVGDETRSGPSFGAMLKDALTSVAQAGSPKPRRNYTQPQS